MDSRVKINDTLVRIIGIQLFGIVIPNATGLITANDYTLKQMLGVYGYFILIAFLIWHGNRYLLFRLQSAANWLVEPIKKAAFLLGANVFFTAPLVIGMLYVWYDFNGMSPNWRVIQITTIACVVCVIFVTHVYETVFLIKQREGDILKGEQLERAKAQAELEALKNQIDPHFMFNSLNSLSYLIENNPKNAKLFAESLAEVYRYILSSKDQKMVLLEDELIFLKEYISLLKLRFDEALNVYFEVKNESGYLIPPISIFIALENVVKHNELSQKRPMKVIIKQDKDALWIINDLIRKQTKPKSTKIGLNNLDERFKIIVGEGIRTFNTKEKFKVKLPMLALTN